MTDLWDFWLSSPAIQGNTIYFGSGDGYFYALDKESGKVKWKFESGGIIHSSPALAFGNVYFGGWDTYLHALNAVTGKEVWNFKTGEDTAIYNQTGITSSPIIDGNMLYFGCRDSHLYALDAGNGKLVWTRYNDGGWISVSPLVAGDKLIYTSGSDKKLTALNKLNGDSIYRYDVPTGMFSSPALTGNLFYYGGMNGLLYARNVNTGELAWDFQLPTSSEDFYHILNPDHTINRDRYLAAIKKYQGTLISMEIRLSVGTILSSPVIKNGGIYFGTTDGYVYVLQ